MVSVEQLTVEFGGFTLFGDLSFVVNQSDKIALVGRNGAGKSTLLKIFAGIQQPTRGKVSFPKDVTIGYLPQHMLHQDNRTVIEEAELAFQNVKDLQKRIDELTLQLSERTDYESDSYHKIIESLTAATEQLQMMGGGNYQAEIEKTLLGLGFLRSDFNRNTGEFSGGWRMRIELAKILLQRPQVLLLDEPTNHLDIESIQWLENFLKTTSSAVILVSHDVAFINAVTNRTIELSLGRITDYKVSYLKYIELRKERREQQLRAYENQQKQIQDTEAFIERFRYKATKSVQVQSRIKQLDKLERIEVEEEDNSMLNLKFPPAPRSGNIPIEISDLRKDYGSHNVFQDVEFMIHRGEKVAFVGKNGEGKSTLVQCIMGEIDYDGLLKIGHNVKIGYFAQNQAQLLDENKTVFETIDYVAQGDIRTKIRDILGAFMFGGEKSDKKVKVLSGGERTRLAMIKLLLEPVNLLILDEPTNHLDIQSKTVLKNAIKDFDGTVIVVSHDREFLDGLVTKVYEFGGGKVREHLGGIYDFLQKKKIENLNELERSIPKKEDKKSDLKVEKTSISSEDLAKNERKLSYEERKELSKRIKKLERAVEESETKISELETKISELEAKIAENPTDTSLYDEHAKLQKAMETEVSVWEVALQELESQK